MNSFDDELRRVFSQQMYETARRDEEQQRSLAISNAQRKLDAKAQIQRFQKIREFVSWQVEPLLRKMLETFSRNAWGETEMTSNLGDKPESVRLNHFYQIEITGKLRHDLGFSIGVRIGENGNIELTTKGVHWGVIISNMSESDCVEKLQQALLKVIEDKSYLRDTTPHDDGVN